MYTIPHFNAFKTTIALTSVAKLTYEAHGAPSKAFL